MRKIKDIFWTCVLWLLYPIIGKIDTDDDWLYDE